LCVKYEAFIAGEYDIRVTLFDVDIKGSPFLMTVQSGFVTQNYNTLTTSSLLYLTQTLQHSYDNCCIEIDSLPRYKFFE